MKFSLVMSAMLAITAFKSKGESSATNAPASTNTPPARAFKVDGYHLVGNTVLPTDKLYFLTNYTGRALTFDRLREGLGQLQLLYRQYGFPTISVTLPEQKLTNGIVEVKIIEGKLESINVVSNRYFSSNNILRALPSLQTNVIINTKWLQPELDRANANPDRQIYPVVAAGSQPGYTELNLEVKDRLPLHGHFEFNDKSTPATPLLRAEGALQYNNLWQLNHQIGLEYEGSPQSVKPGNYPFAFYDQPQVVSYSGFYRMPLGAGPELREDYEKLPVEFGYDEITHRFNLPPASGSPELIFYASRSAADTYLRDGPLTTVAQNSVARITSQSSEQDLTVTENLGVKYNLPLADWSGLRSEISLGFDFKNYRAFGFSTNNYNFVTVTTNNGVVSSGAGNLAFGANTAHTLTYEPLSLGWSGQRPDKFGIWSFNESQNLFLSGLASARSNFQAVAGSTAAGGNYASFSANVTREQKLSHDWSILAHGTAHWATAPLIGNEQFALGGTGGVRGYQEGENYSDVGWKLTSDLRAPAHWFGDFPINGGSVPAYVRPSLFMDYGEGWLRNHPGATTDRQWGAGLGAFVTAGQHFEARLSLGWALLRTPTTTPGSVQAYFSVGTQF